MFTNSEGQPRNRAAVDHESKNVLRNLASPDHSKAEAVRLFHALEAASDRLALANDMVGYAMTLRVLNSTSL